MRLVLELLPISVLWALWLHSVWRQRRAASGYAPAKGTPDADVTVVAAVYDASAASLEQSLDSWIKNDPKEIVVVIDAKNTACIALCEERASRFPLLRVRVTQAPGKRRAIAEGIDRATSDIVVLTDADTTWSSTFLREITKPFSDASIGAVCGNDRVLSPRTFAQRTYDTVQLLACEVTLPADAAEGRQPAFLSGRCSAYRRGILASAVEGLLAEGSGEGYRTGDDVYLAFAVKSAGHGTAFQSTARCWTIGETSLTRHWSQIVRWSRNVLRAQRNGYFTDGKTPRHGKFHGYVRILAHVLFPHFLLAFFVARDVDAVVVGLVGAMAAGAAVMSWCGASPGRSLALAGYAIIGQIVVAYGTLLAFVTIGHDDAWSSRDAGNSAARATKGGKTAYALLLLSSIAVVHAYVFATHLLPR